MKTLPEIKKGLKELLTEGIDLALEAMEKLLGSSSKSLNELLLLKSRYKESNKKLLTGLISDADAQLEFNKIRAALLDFIDLIEEQDLSKNETAQTQPAIYNGEVLYRIPQQMQKEVEVTCTVRLAFSKEELYIGLEKASHDVVKDLRISDVMGVELIDPSANEAFAIRTYSEQVQFVEKGLPTEWLFYVKPLKEGTWPLILKISVIEIINGVERKRNLVLEEKVKISTEPVPEEENRESAATNLSTAVAGIALSGGGAANAPKPPPPAAPSSMPSAPPSVMTPARKSSTLKKLSTALPIALVMMVAVWALSRQLLPVDEGPDSALVKRFEKARKNGDIEELRNIAEIAPDAELAAESKSALDSLDQAVWQEALAQRNPEKYLDRFPNGRFVEEANQKINSDLAENASSTGTTGEVNAIEQEPRITAPSSHNNAAGPSQTEEPAVPLATSHRKPIYPGCENNNRKREESCTASRIRRFVGRQLRYPAEAQRKRVEGVVTVSFIVEKNGVISQVRALNSLGYGCEEEAVRLVKKLPRFEPGHDANGRPIRVQYQLPIRFKLM